MSLNKHTKLKIEQQFRIKLKHKAFIIEDIDEDDIIYMAHNAIEGDVYNGNDKEQFKHYET